MVFIILLRSFIFGVLGCFSSGAQEATLTLYSGFTLIDVLSLKRGLAACKTRSLSLVWPLWLSHFHTLQRLSEQSDCRILLYLANNNGTSDRMCRRGNYDYLKKVFLSVIKFIWFMIIWFHKILLSLTILSWSSFILFYIKSIE